MAKLSAVRPRVQALRSRIGGVAGDRKAMDQARDQRPWRRWYKTARWQALRWQTLVRDLFTCQRCGRIEGDTPQLVADHRKPHRGDAALFWSQANLWTLCVNCHSSAKQREERRDP